MSLPTKIQMAMEDDFEKLEEYVDKLVEKWGKDRVEAWLSSKSFFLNPPNKKEVEEVIKK